MFGNSKSKAVDEVGDRNEDEILQQKKEYHRQLEVLFSFIYVKCLLNINI